jgi:hypothetical protein
MNRSGSRIALCFAALAVLSAAAASCFYPDSPGYMILFTLLGAVLAAYFVGMARVFGFKPSFRSFFTTWIISLAAMSAVEIYFQTMPATAGDAPPGMLPTIVAAVESWRNPNVAPPWTGTGAGAASTVTIRDPYVLSVMSAAILEEYCHDTDLGDLATYNRKFIGSFPGKLNTVSDIHMDENQLRQARLAWRNVEKIEAYELQNFRIASRFGILVLGNSKGPDEAKLLHRFTEAQDRLISSRMVRNELQVPISQLAESLIDESLSVEAAGKVSKQDIQAWDSLAQKNLKYQSEDYKKQFPDFRYTDFQTLKQLRELIDQDTLGNPRARNTYGICSQGAVGSVDRDSPEAISAAADRIIGGWKSQGWLPKPRH